MGVLCRWVYRVGRCTACVCTACVRGAVYGWVCVWGVPCGWVYYVWVCVLCVGVRAMCGVCYAGVRTLCTPSGCVLYTLCEGVLPICYEKKLIYYYLFCMLLK